MGTQRHIVIAFDRDSAVLSADHQRAVADAAARWLAGEDVELVSSGPFGASRSAADRHAVSVRRATAVQNALIAQGVPAQQIAVDIGCTITGVPVSEVDARDRPRPFPIVIAPRLYTQSTCPEM